MGYTTDFSGAFKVTPAIKPAHRKYLKEFARTRRMKRDAKRAEKLSDPIRKAVKLGIGEEGGYYVGSGDSNPDRPKGKGGVLSGFGQQEDLSVLDHNGPPKGQPGLWCQWVPNKDGTAIEWDGGEKFYDYEEWLAYLIEHFLKPWGYRLDGDVEWQGEEPSDQGILRVEDNRIRTAHFEREVVWD